MRNDMPPSRFLLRRCTARLRALPDFLIVGTQKSGTTSLYRYLLDSPDIVAPALKEVDYFRQYAHCNLWWYRSHFPLRWELPSRGQAPARKTFEATANYFFAPSVAKRISQALPDIPLIVLFRDPVQRTFSHFNYKPLPNISAPDAIAQEIDRIRGREHELFRADASGQAMISQLPTLYVVKSLYYYALVQWYECFPKERILLLKAEDLFTKPRETVDQVCRFVGITPPVREDYPAFNQGEKRVADSELVRKLSEYYQPHNEKLYELLGSDWQW